MGVTEGERFRILCRSLRDTLKSAKIPLCDLAGDPVAWLEVTPVRDDQGQRHDSLVEIDPAMAKRYGETEIQLKEAESYEYVLSGLTDVKLCLRSSLSKRRSNLRDGEPDAGRIETRNFCGTLLLELVEGEATWDKVPVGTALIDVRSLKVDYRTEYRGMLRDLSTRLEGLVVDAQSSATISFRSNFEERTDEGWLQIQLEFLRDMLDGAEFDAALSRILAFPHERLTPKHETVSTDRPIKFRRDALRQLFHGSPRRLLPESHPMKSRKGMISISERITLPRNYRDLDTAENRFVKFVLEDLRSFLNHARTIFESKPAFASSSLLSKRLSDKLADLLSRSFFKDIGPMRLPPLGSPVLQRKAGYREVLRTWLRFRTSAELSWEGGEDVFRAGQRDVATLYEYWLFFVLLDWFCRKCQLENGTPDISKLVDGLEEGAPGLRLKKRTHLGPFVGEFSGTGRKLNAQFDYNRVFGIASSREQAGSWTRRLHPDYTLTFWPEEFTLDEAQERELLVHVHFDAKYRVETIEKLFGQSEEGTDFSDDEDSNGNYKRQDLLKMHAYRDAIRRSQGAYVLYPGQKNSVFRGFHEILPGLGAFGISPDEAGEPKGLEALDGFLKDVLDHISNRATSQERVSYHVWNSYGPESGSVVKEMTQDYSVSFSESDSLFPEFRALPPAEEMVLVAWYQNSAQLDLAMRDDGVAYVRLGTRRGALHVHPNFARTRYMMLRSAAGVVANGLCALREEGYRVYTRAQLRDLLAQMGANLGVAAWQTSAQLDDDESIYAVFSVCPDPIFSSCRWSGDKVMEMIERFETDKRNKLVTNLGRTSSYPRILPMRDVLLTRLGPST